MKITSQQLRRIIREEYSRVINENLGSSNFVVTELFDEYKGFSLVAFPAAWLTNYNELIIPERGEEYSKMAPPETPDAQLADYVMHISPKSVDQLKSEGHLVLVEGSHAHLSFEEKSELLPIIRDLIMEGVDKDSGMSVFH